MHLYLITRGIKNHVDQFITELQGKYLSMNYQGKPSYVPVMVRPIQLWEIVFPEDHKELMLNSIFQGADGGKTQHKKHQKFIYMLRKILGASPLPKEYKKGQIMPIYGADVEKIGIGLKKDYWVDKDGKHIFNPTEEQKEECRKFGFEGL